MEGMFQVFCFRGFWCLWECKKKRNWVFSGDRTTLKYLGVASWPSQLLEGAACPHKLPRCSVSDFDQLYSYGTPVPARSSARP